MDLEQQKGKVTKVDFFHVSTFEIIMIQVYEQV